MVGQRFSGAFYHFFFFYIYLDHFSRMIRSLKASLHWLPFVWLNGVANIAYGTSHIVMVLSVAGMVTGAILNKFFCLAPPYKPLGIQRYIIKISMTQDGKFCHSPCQCVHKTHCHTFRKVIVVTLFGNICEWSNNNYISGINFSERVGSGVTAGEF